VPLHSVWFIIIPLQHDWGACSDKTTLAAGGPVTGVYHLLHFRGKYMITKQLTNEPKLFLYAARQGLKQETSQVPGIHRVTFCTQI